MTPERIKFIASKMDVMISIIKNALPMFGTADTTLRFETPEEVKAIGEALGLKVYEPTGVLNVHWCLFKAGTVSVYIQTHETEKKITAETLNQVKGN